MCSPHSWFCRRSATTRDKLVAFYEQFYQRLATLPGSASAALTDRVPLTGAQTPAPVAVIGRPVPPMSERPHANRHLVSPGYFATLGIPIRAGRDFDERDSARVPHVVIVNETFARRHFPGENPIGRTLITGMAQLPSEIVGVVADVRSTGLNTPPEADYFLPALQRPETFTNILVRTNLAPRRDDAGWSERPCGQSTPTCRCFSRKRCPRASPRPLPTGSWPLPCWLDSRRWLWCWPASASTA